MPTMNTPLAYAALMLLVCHKTAAEIRLVGGSNSNEGRVEVSRGWGWFTSWGTVCDDSWGTNDAKVVCRQLGLPYSNAEALGGAEFGQGSGDIFLDDVGCSGSESRLEDCSHPGWEEHNCGHSEDAGVRCSSSSSSSSSSSDSRSVQVRLVGGSSSNEGRVEVYRNNGWGTVCDDSWGTNDAKVVCRQLGLPFSNAEALGNAEFGQGSGEIFLDDVGCSGSESSLDDCSHSGWGEHNCGHGEDAGVRCFGVDCYPNVGCFPLRSYCGDGVLELFNTPRSPDDINTRFFLYTSSPSSYQVITNQMTGAQFRAKGLDPSRHTKIVIHGFDHSAFGDGIVDIRNAFLDQTTSLNIIMVDWNSEDLLAALVSLGADYRQATQDVRVVAKELQLLLQRLNGEVGLQYDDVHIIGHSLGAHTAGLAGALLDGQLGRISGLDPAKSAFQGKDPRCRLDAEDARFVDIIHTDISIVGTNDQSGHVDFWPNLGYSQPGCFLSGDLGCSHERALFYYAESIRGNCEYQSYLCGGRRQPDTFTSCSNCPRMGYNADSSNEGEFCLATTGATPFC